MTPTPFVLSHLPETPSQTAGPYVHIGIISAGTSPVRMSWVSASSLKGESSMAPAT
jgi:protocatechuate 3,4-dioxygenase beta subunit